MASVLIGCEESQTVCIAFRNEGHEAYSNDLKDCSGGFPEWHRKKDVMEAIKERYWDLIGLHPECTAMTTSGNRHYAEGKPLHHLRIAAMQWTVELWELAKKHAKCVYLENPVGSLNGIESLPRPQIIQPYFFGDEFQKTTCLWLHNLKPLLHSATDTLFETQTHVDRGEMTTFKSSGKVMPKWYADSKSLPEAQRKQLRSKTFPGIATAMSQQWGPLL